MGQVYLLVLALLLTLLLAYLLDGKDERPAILIWLGRLLLFLLCARSLDWLSAGAALGPNDLPAPVPLSGSVDHIIMQVSAGLFAFGFLRARARFWFLGAVCGALFAGLGFCAARWLAVAQAWRLIGYFAGPFLVVTLPFWLAVSCGVAAAALLVDDAAAVRGRVLGPLLALWFGGAMFCQHKLEAGWDFGPRSLAEAAGLPALAQAPSVSVALLKPAGGEPYRVEQKKAELGGLNVSQESLVKLYQYLDSRAYRSIFWRRGLKALRQGWLFWWDADRALKAASLAVPGRAAPDYRQALSLIRSGPQTQARMSALESLSNQAKPRKEGFEDVTQSQYIFEGFSGAYARLGNEDQARWWLLKIDNLWPIYEKKIEVTQVEAMHDGEVGGSVLLSSAPAEGMLVGLFYLGTSTTTETALSSGTLSDSMLADAQGRFKFSYLGPGRYYLGLLGAPSDLGGRIHDSPGIIDLSKDVPVARLAPIIIEK